MDKLQAIRGIAFDLDGTLVDSAPGLTSAVDNALYALELPVAGEERVVTDWQRRRCPDGAGADLGSSGACDVTCGDGQALRRRS